MHTPLTTHVQFEVFIRKTNQEFSDETSPQLIQDLQTIEYKQNGSSTSFSTADTIEEFRNIMINKPSNKRFVHITKIIKGKNSKLDKDIEYILGPTNVLALEMESLRDVLYLKKSSKSAIKKGIDNPYNLNIGDTIIARFTHQQNYYEMLCEVVETRNHNEIVRPIRPIQPESGLRSKVVDYSNGGILLESSSELLKYLLGEECPSDVDNTPDYTSDYWQQAFNNLRNQMLHITFYPKLNFPDAVKSYKPEIPFKFALIAQAVRTDYKLQEDKHPILQHGLQFAYDSTSIPVEYDDIVPWRYTRSIKDNLYLKSVHTSLSKLYGYLENQSLSAKSTSHQKRDKKVPHS